MKDDLLSFLDGIELAELHTHLGFSVSPTMLWELAHDQGLKLPVRSYFDFEKLITIRSAKPYEEYIAMFDLTEKIQSSPDALFHAAKHAVSQAYRLNNITLLELRFNPMMRNHGGEKDLDHLIVYTLQGIERAMLAYPVRAGIILMMDRRFKPEVNDVIVHKAIKYKNRGVIGVDLAGPIERTGQSRAFRPKDIRTSVEKAREHGLGITVHTGEVTNTDEMWEAVEELKPDRIAHGIACVKDKKLMKHLSGNATTLDLCPTSNLHTGAIKNMDHMKEIFTALLEYDVPFSVNTDGPEMNGTSLRREYGLLYNAGILTKEQILDSVKRAHRASFIAGKEKNI